METESRNDLLEQLRIDRGSHDESEASPAAPALWIGAAMAVLGLLAGGYFLLARGSAIKVSEATAVAPTALSAPVAVLQASGYVTAAREATVSAQTAGVLTEVYVQEGEYVHRGQVLARLDDSSQRAAQARAQAQWQAARAQLGQYQARLEQARWDLARDQALIGQHLISEQALEQARTETASLAAEVKSQRLQIAVARADIGAARVQERYTVVRAPFSGVVVDKAAQMGEAISPFFGGGGFTQTGVATIVDMNSLEVDVDVNEAYIQRVRPEQPATAVLDAYPNWHIPAHVIAIVPTANKSKATVQVRIALDKKDPRILPEMGVRVSFLQDASKPGAGAGAVPADMVLVPASAVVKRGDHSLVFEIDEGRARARVVTLGPVRGDLQAVSGITGGTSVVRLPPARLRSGEHVITEQE